MWCEAPTCGFSGCEGWLAGWCVAMSEGLCWLSSLLPPWVLLGA